MTDGPIGPNPGELGPRIRALRSQRRLTLRQLADASGLTTSFLSKLERGHTTVSIGSLEKLSRALEIPATQLLVPAPRLSVVRGAAPDMTPALDGEARVSQLTPPSERRLHAEQTTLAPGQERTLPGADDDHVELFFVLSGTLAIETNDEHCSLASGDAATVTAGSEFRLTSTDAAGTVFLRIVTPDFRTATVNVPE